MPTVSKISVTPEAYLGSLLSTLVAGIIRLVFAYVTVRISLSLLFVAKIENEYSHALQSQERTGILHGHDVDFA